MDLGLRDKVVIITGGTRGNGKAISFGFASEGAKVSFCGKTEDKLNKVSKEIRNMTGASVLANKADITKREEIERFVKNTLDAFGRIDIIVNNAIGPGVKNPAEWFDEISDEEICSSMERKYIPYSRCIRTVIPQMIKQGGGKIINIAGNSGVIDYGAGHMVMSYNNAAVIRLTTDLACNLAKYNILVNAVCPGPVNTDRWKQLVTYWASSKGVSEEEILNQMISRIPLRRIAEPEDIANIVVFLASDKADYLTGAILYTDGGVTLRF
jgi:3-oxoacyl-[acyl-carrier protein] reductase